LRRRVFALLVLAIAAWVVTALAIEPLASMVGIARYRLVENGNYDQAEHLERIVLNVARLARALRMPGAMRLQASSLADRADTEQAEGELPEAESFYLRAIEVYQRNGMDHDPRLAGVLGSYAVLLSRLGRTREAEGVDERARAIGELPVPRPQTK
jgi:hypothetical protein